MAKRIGGYRRKTRKLMRKPVRERGKLKITSFMEDYKPGESVILKAEPAYHKGLFNLRFQGRNGVVVGKRGKCFEIEMYDGNKKKRLFIPAIHVMRVK